MRVGQGNQNKRGKNTKSYLMNFSDKEWKILRENFMASDFQYMADYIRSSLFEKNANEVNGSSDGWDW